jgi:hypothetical protein
MNSPSFRCGKVGRLISSIFVEPFSLVKNEAPFALFFIYFYRRQTFPNQSSHE